MRRKLLLALLIGVAPLLACGDSTPEEAPPRTAAEQTLWLFEIADQGQLAPEQMAELFEIPEDEKRRALLFDAVEQLAANGTPRIVAEVELPELQRIAIDLAREDGEAVALYSVQLNSVSTPPKISWFSGPGVEWPERSRRGDGLSSSAPPSSSRND